MATTVIWNDATPPGNDGEHMTAWWLAAVARSVGITSVTPGNRSEWLWRWAFMQEIGGRRFGDYESEMSLFAEALDRFCGVTMEGRVGDDDREEFVRFAVEEKIASARDQADGVVAQHEEQAAA